MTDTATSAPEAVVRDQKPRNQKIGRVSSIRTMSPSLQLFWSSCAMNLLVRVIRL